MKAILFLALCAMATSVYGQIEKGPVTLTGTLDYSSGEVTSGSSQSDFDSFMFGVGVGKLIKEDLMLTLFAVYTKTGTNGDSKSNSFGIGPTIRKYHMYNEKFGWFLEGGFGLTFGTNTFSNGFQDFDQDMTNISVHVAPGFSFFPTNKIGLEFKLDGLRYVQSKVSGDSFQDIETKNLSLGINPLDFTVGASYFFGR